MEEMFIEVWANSDARHRLRYRKENVAVSVVKPDAETIKAGGYARLLVPFGITKETIDHDFIVIKGE